LTAPDAAASGIGVTAARVVEVCVDPASPLGSYSFALGTPAPVVAGDAAVPSPVVINTALPGATCANVFTRSTTGDPTNSFISVTASTGVPGTFSYTCIDDIATSNVLCPAAAGVNGASGGLNSFHGSVITFLFVAAPPPPTGVGCTVTRGFIKNQLDLITNNVGPKITVTINGVTLTKEQIFAALDAPTRGDSRVQLKAQLITALANISLGATTNPAVNAAITNAQLYLLAGSTATQSQISAAISTLTSFNEGTAGNGASDHCDSAEEAILKDKA